VLEIHRDQIETGEEMFEQTVRSVAEGKAEKPAITGFFRKHTDG
jgi:hypothetical protein